MLLSCSGLKLSKDTNCLNVNSGCFKPDKTSPQFKSSSPTTAESYTVLDYVDITFSEEVKNGEEKSAYELPKTGGAANGLEIQSVQRISQYTYRLFLGGASISTGQIRIYFTNIRDYNDNMLTGPNYVDYTGSANIPITLSVTHLGRPVYGVSNDSVSPFSALRFYDVDITFSHDFRADNANTYEVYQKTGASACSGTLIGSGTNLQYGTSIPVITRLASTFSTSPAVSRIVVCVTNQNNPTAVGIVSWQIVRDDGIPAVSRSIPPGDYPNPQTFALTCADDNPDRIAYTSSMQKDTAPGAPAAPGFAADGSINATSNLYSTSLTAANPLNPTYTIFRWQCIDKAGNRSVIPAAEQYYIDSTIPAVNITVDNTYRAYISNAVNPNTTIKFTTDQVSRDYHIRRNGTTCAGGGDGFEIAGGTTPATAGMQISHTFTTGTDFTAEGSYDVRICVQGPTSIWGTAYLQIIRDDTQPLITPTITSGTYAAVQVVEFTCTDTNLHQAAYRRSTVLGGIAPTPAPTPPTFNTATGDLTSTDNLSGPYTTPDASTTIVAYGCIDKAGNQATTGSQQYRIDGTVPAVTFVSLDHSGVTINSSGYTSVNIVWNSSKAGVNYPGNNYQVRVGATNCSTGSVAASGLTPATPGTNVQTTLPASAFTNDGQAYAIKICVENYAGTFGSQTAPITVTRDDQPPTFAGLTGLVASGMGSYVLSWNAANETGSGVQTYQLYQTTSQGVYALTPTYTAAPAATQLTVNGLNPPDVYYFIAGVIDNAGNETKVTVAELRTRFNLNVAVTGYTTGFGDFIVRQGSDQLTFTSPLVSPQTFTTGFTPGSTYNVSVISQPGRQNCAFTGNQYGTINSDITLNVQCVAGYFTGNGMATNPPVPLNFHLYRGNSVIVGGGSAGTNCGPGCNNGTGSANIRFDQPHGITHLKGNIYTTEYNTHQIRQYTIATATMTTIAGASTLGSADDPTGTNARFNRPNSVTTDGVSLYVSELGGQRIRRVSLTAPYAVTTLAGGGATGTPCPGVAQATCLDGPGLAARFAQINHLHYDSGYIYIADYTHNRVRRFNLSTGMVETIAGTGAAGGSDGDGAVATFNTPTGLTSAGGYLYVADINANKIRRISMTAPFAVTTVVGTGVPGKIDGPVSVARINAPDHLTTDGSNLFIADFGSHIIRRFDLRTNILSTISGYGASDVNGVGPAAGMASPVGIVTDGRRLFTVSHSGNNLHRIADQGLIGYWTINPSVDPDDYNSELASPATSSVVNSPLSTTPDRYGTGTASLFNGTTQYVSSGTSGVPSDLDQSVTLAAWVKITDLSQESAIMGTANFRFRFNVATNGSVYFQNWYSSGSATKHLASTSGGLVTPGVWVHIAYVHRPGTAVNPGGRIYINGHDMTSESTSVGSTSDAVNVPLTIGYSTASSIQTYMKGALANVRVYSRALSEGELNELAQDAAAGVVGNSFNTGGTGLLAHYEFSSGANAAASAPIGGALAFTGGPSTTVSGKDGDMNAALHFNGTTQYYTGDATGLPIGSAARTLCAWVSPVLNPAYSPERYPIISYGNTYFDMVYYNAAATGANDYRLALTDNGTIIHEAQVTLPLNTWTHVCGTNDGAQSAIYKDGARIFLGGGAFAGPGSAGNFRIGARTTTLARKFSGKIDDVRIYDNALSANQIRQLATQVPEGLILRLDMNGDASDVSGFGHTSISNTGSPASGRKGQAGTAYRFVAPQVTTLGHSQAATGHLNMTWSFWLKSPNMGNVSGEIMAKYVNTPSGWVIKYDQTGFAHGWTVGSSAASGAFSNSFSVPSNNVWNHFAYVRNGAGMTIYINGAPYSNLVYGNGTAIIPNVVNVNIGLNGAGGDVTLQDARIYNRALTAAEVRALSGYHAVQGTSGLALHVQADTYSNLTDGVPVTSNWINSVIQTPAGASGAVAGNPRFVSGGGSLLGGQPAIEFDGTTGKYFDFGTPTYSYSGLTVCTAATRKGNGYRGLVEKRGASSPGNSWGMLTDLPTDALKFEMNSLSSAEVVSPVSNDAPTIYCAISGTGDTLSSYVNGQASTATSKTIISGSNADKLVVGARYDLAGSYYGQIGEIFVMTKDATAAERQIAECYLSAKYSVPLASSIICP